MEENNTKKAKVRQVSIAVAVCVTIVGCLMGLSVGIYNAFYGENGNAIQTFAEKEVEEDNNEEVVDIDLEEQDENEQENIEENIEEENIEEKKEEISEEERQKQEEERKRTEEEQRKRQEEEQRRLSEGYPYWIKVNYTANTVTVYSMDENGNYTIPVKAMICSTGQATPTSGVYRTPQKARWGLLIGPSWGQYCTRITGQILFHSVPYDRQSEDSLHTVYYDRLGITTSLGCIRLTVADAKWLYDNCPLGTCVEFYSSPDPGPLGKPTAMKISGYGEPLNRWDPTDPHPDNPWHSYLRQNSEETNEVVVDTGETNNEQHEETPSPEPHVEPETPTTPETPSTPEVPPTPEIPTVQKVVVPNVVGMNEQDARNKLQDFSVTINEISDTSRSNGVVVEQQYTAGTELEKGTTIKLTINKCIEPNEGTININVKSITGYTEEDIDGNAVEPNMVSVKVSANNNLIYTNQVLENSELLQVVVKGTGIATINVLVGDKSINTQINLNEKNQVVSVE